MAETEPVPGPEDFFIGGDEPPMNEVIVGGKKHHKGKKKVRKSKKNKKSMKKSKKSMKKNKKSIRKSKKNRKSKKQRGGSGCGCMAN